jgi:thiol-disulfide isomerase/thioredoxin
MRKLLLLAITACSLLSIVWAADPPREADLILREYDEVKHPSFDPSRSVYAEYNRIYAEEREAARAKRYALAKELYTSHPRFPRARTVMHSELVNAISAGQTAKAIADIEQFVNDHPKSDIGASVLLALGRDTEDKEKRVAIFRRIVAEYPPTQNTKKAEGCIRREEGVGKPFELTFTDAITDQLISIKNLRGKVVVIDFWATWCAPCVADMPKLKKLYEQYKDQGVEFIGVSLDRPGEGLNLLKTFVKENGIAWPQYYQGNWWASEFSTSWGIERFPSTFIVDAEGNLYSTEAYGRLDKLIPELIKKRDG